MTAKEIKTEIQKSMDKVPESVLKEVLEYHPPHAVLSLQLRTQLKL